ncbi:MAG: twin-arginine translocase TatA/TatE family subunit [Gemmatimonadota bacterium]
MFGNLGMPEVLAIIVILLLLFGARRLPEIGGALGKGIREFRSSVKDVGGEMRKEIQSGDEDVGSTTSESVPHRDEHTV